MLFVNDASCLGIPCDVLIHKQIQKTDWPKRMPWTFHKMFDYFLNPTLLLQEGLQGPKESQLDKKSRFFVNVVNIHSRQTKVLQDNWLILRSIVSYVEGLRGPQEGLVNQKLGFSHNETSTLVPNTTMSPYNIPKFIKWTFFRIVWLVFSSIKIFYGSIGPKNPGNMY